MFQKSTTKKKKNLLNPKKNHNKILDFYFSVKGV